MILLIVAWCSRHEKHLIDFLFKFLKHQWAVIHSRWQAESVVYQSLLTAKITEVHPSELWQSNMGLVHNNQIIISEIVQETHRCLARLLIGHMSGIVLDT